MKCNHCGIYFDDSEKVCPICGTRVGAASTPILKPATPSAAPKAKPKKAFSALSIVIGVIISISIANSTLIGQYLEHMQQNTPEIYSDYTDEAVISPQSDSYSVLGFWSFSISDEMDAYLSLYDDGTYTLDYVYEDVPFTEQGDAMIYPLDTPDAIGASYPDGYDADNCLTYLLDLYPYAEPYEVDGDESMSEPDTLEESLPEAVEEEASESLSFLVFQDAYDTDAAMLCPLDETMRYDPLTSFFMYRD